MLFDLLERQAAERPRQEALICSGERLSWGELHERALCISAGLSQLGLELDDVVALLMPNSVVFVATLLALARIGIQAMPLNVDLRLPEIRQAVQAAGCRTLLAADNAALEPGLANRIVQVSREDFGRPSLARLIRDSSRIVGTVHVDPEAPFYHILTSGTTGSPKRLIRTQGALARLATAYGCALDLTPSNRTLCVIPLHHGHGLCAGLLGPLHSGGTLVLEPGFERRTTLKRLQEEHIACFSAPPVIYSVLADSVRGQRFECPTLRWALTSGAPLTQAGFLLVRDSLGIRLRQFYGSSETGIVAMNLDDDPEHTVESVGRPISGARIAITEEGNISVIAPGASGWIASSDTGGAPARLADADGWIRMSDLGRLDAGRLYLTGRKSRFINIAGRKVDPMEVEAVLASHPCVTKAIVSAMRDQQATESAKAVVYCSQPVSREELVACCMERLAPYKVPRVIEVRDAADRRK